MTEYRSSGPFDEDTVTAFGDLNTADLRPAELRASLVVLSGHSAGRTYALSGATVLGRDPEVDLMVDGSMVSRRHARVARGEDGEWTVQDLGSRNGTLLNGEPITERPLRFGDRVSLGGEVLLLFTQHDRLQEQLLHQQRMESIGQLAGGIAHDFNNLLGTILGNASALGELGPERPLADPEVVEVLEDIRMAARQAAQLTRQLLDFARRSRDAHHALDLSEVLVEVARLCRRTFPRSVRIQTQIAEGLRVVGDRAQLHQLVMNVLLNSRDAMPDGGTVTIDAKLDLSRGSEESRVVIVIRDTGIGMSDEVSRRAFEPFFTTKGLGRGTGLGLATAYGIAKNHAGEVQLHSAPGHGTAFRIDLPACSAVVSEGPSTDTPMPRELSEHGTILVVDDEELNLRSSRRLLERSGWSVVTARNGREGLETYHQHRGNIRLVLMDVMMPVMDGEEACMKLRASNPALPIVIMSGYTERDRQEDIIAAGADVFLRKPFDGAALELAIAEALDKAAAR